jgi:hypothetical protein
MREAASAHIESRLINVPSKSHQIVAHVMRIGLNRDLFCVRTVSHTVGNPEYTPSFTGTLQRTSMLRKLIAGTSVGGIWCASARASRINFQACSFNHSDISPL